jgi:hypothetical protein
MKKLLAALGTALLISASQATIIVVDNFTTNQGPVTDADVTANAPSAFGVCDTSGSPFSRNLCIDSISSTVAPVNSMAQVVAGALDITNGVGDNSIAYVRWTLPANFLGTTTLASFFFNVVGSDANPTNVQAFMGSTSIGSVVVPGNTVNLPVLFSVPVAAVNAGGVLTLKISGAPGWDLNLDTVGFNIPAPGIVLLLGAGLVGLGLRRKV